MEVQTVEKLIQMNIKAMAHSYREDIENSALSNYTVSEYLARITDLEWDHRQNRKISNLKKAASFRQQAHPLQIDYKSDRSLDNQVMQRILRLDFIKRAENIIITGLTGTGKSYLAQAIGVQACEMLYKTLYYPMSIFSDTVLTMNIQGTYIKWMKGLKNVPLLILDDFGLTNFTSETRKALMEIVDYKYGRSAVIFASQIPVKKWHELLGESTIADAIMDRIVHNSHRIKLTGESMRRKNKLKS
ncbi:IS21-like element helper ATPase IstB [Portibacter marinus]|uniref:IS21-like element helper ATPase IstB n=1 Tax=Portibacter marinus TaxID=2898660 RepID=UPI001F1E8DAA|nr:IS21-like element helper ATPase IstB [Portibacter marinus]